MATGKKTGGRQRGTPNKANAIKTAKVVATSETPLDYMLRVMRDPSADHERRDRMAKDAAPYVHPRLATTEVTGKDGGPVLIEKIERVIVRPNAADTNR